MPLPQFLAVVLLVMLLAGLTALVAVGAGIPLPVLALLALIAAGVARLMMRVE